MSGTNCTMTLKARLHGSPRLINTVESTKVNRVNSSFRRKWSTWLTGEQVQRRSASLIHFGWLTTDCPYQQASHDLFPRVERVERCFFLLFLFFLKCVDILPLNSHISQHHFPPQVHLPPFRNRRPRLPLWNCVNSIVQPLNSISLIQPRWSTWGTRVNPPLVMF